MKKEINLVTNNHTKGMNKMKTGRNLIAMMAAGILFSGGSASAQTIEKR